MALKTFFNGKSASGNLEEAIQNALKKARRSHADNFKWVVERIAENQLTFPPISVRIRVGGAKGTPAVSVHTKSGKTTLLQARSIVNYCII